MAKYKIIPSSRTIVQSPISIGHKAEKGVEAIEFDLTAWVETYGSGTLTVIMRRWGDAIPYPIALEIDENNKATWALSDIDTAKAGMAYAQLSYIVGDEVVKKSDIYTFRVMDSLTGEGEPPEAYESWLEHLTHLAAEAMAEVLDIEGIVTDKTLSIEGGIADAKATGEALAEKVDAADYSELSDRVGRNTIALAEKADKSTTYTKTEVDQMIEDVEVETDTTLAVSGAPADAAETGRQIGLIKADLGDVAESIFSSDKSKAISSVLTNEWAEYSIDPVSSQTRISAYPYNQYKTYWLIFRQPSSVWFEETPTVSYVSIGIIDGAATPTKDSNNIWIVNGTGGAARYRKSEGNLPTPTSKLQIAAGSFLAVTIPTTTSAEDFYMSFDIGGADVDTTLLNNTVRLNTTQINQAKSSNFVEYINEAGSDSSTKRLNIYIAQPSGKYILYEFACCVSASINANIWRVAYARLINSSFSVEKDITTAGEWECAIKLDGRSDFAGGFLHGDEIATQTACFIDGKKTGLSSIVGKMPFKKLTFVQRSNLYDPNDSTTIFAVHGSTHEFTDKLTIRQSLTFSGAYTMGLSYLAMFPIAKTVSPKAFTDMDFNYAAVSLPVSIHGASKVTLTDDSITAEFELKNHSEVDSGTGDLSILDNGGNAYNKCYFISCHSGTTVASGDTWKAETEYRIMG